MIDLVEHLRSWPTVLHKRAADRIEELEGVLDRADAHTAMLMKSIKELETRLKAAEYAARVNWDGWRQELQRNDSSRIEELESALRAKPLGPCTQAEIDAKNSHLVLLWSDRAFAAEKRIEALEAALRTAANIIYSTQDSDYQAVYNEICAALAAKGSDMIDKALK